MQYFYKKDFWNSFIHPWKFLIFFGLIFQFLLSVEHFEIESELSEENLLYFIQQNFTPENVPNYDASRDIIFSTLNNFDNQVSCVYSGYTINLIGGYCDCETGNEDCDSNDNPTNCNSNNGNWVVENDPSTEAYYKNLNIEHTWPRSKGAEYGHPKSDMHHLFPTKSNVNSSRGNDPFAEIPDEDTHKWYKDTEILYDIPTSDIDDYAEKFNPENHPELERFEPKEDHKGNVARAMFYFYAIYQDSANVEFWNIQKSTFLEWHYADPVDSEEFLRTELIANYQSNLKNPFIIDSTLARRIWYYHEDSGNPQITFNTNEIIVEESNLSIPLSIQLINPPLEQNTTVEIQLLESNLTELEYSISQTQFTFLPNGELNQDININLFDDEVYEGSESFTLGLNIINGENVSIGNPGIFNLKIMEDDFPQIVITEVMINPQNISDANGEWFEIYIENQIPINFKNWIIKDNDTDDFLITENLIIQNNSYAVFGNNSNYSSNGGVETDFEYNQINLANGGDELYLISPEGFLADSIWWDGGSQFPFSNGNSMALINPELDNLNPQNWQESDLVFSSGDYGTPGFENCFSPNEIDECGICGGNGQSCNLLLGDVNLDGNVNIVDVVVLVGFILDNESPNPDQFYTSDLNQDLALNIVDVVQIVGIILSD